MVIHTLAAIEVTQKHFDYCFFAVLIIFVLTALLVVAALPGWIAIPDKYTHKLFYALVMEVIACIIGFVSLVFGTAISGRIYTNEKILEQLTDNKWVWNYTETGWVGRGEFFIDYQDDERLKFYMTVFYINPEDKQKIRLWKYESNGEVVIQENGHVVVPCKQVIYPSVNKAYTENAPIPGAYQADITLTPEMALAGTWRAVRNGDSAEDRKSYEAVFTPSQ